MNWFKKPFFSDLKGSYRDPFLRLALILVILVVSIPFKSGLMPKLLIDKGRFCLATISEAVEGTQKKEICLEKQIKTLSEVFLDSNKRALPESPELLLVGEGSVKASSPPTTFSPQVLGALVGGYEPEDAQNVIIEYVVEPEETLSSIANKFSISLNTVLWANNLNKNSQLQPGITKLIIPPVSGVVYHVKTGDTISAIAEKYKAKTDEIADFNNLSNDEDIYIGDILIIPNGVMPSAPVYVAPQAVPLPNSYFMCPSIPCRITQGLHWYNAVDFNSGEEGNNNCGKPIYAAAGGTILKVKLTNSTSRWAFGGAGNTITILHPNGVVTSYGHIAVSLVNPGQPVSQGQAIALMGGQPGIPGAGLSTGCHVHFGVSGAKNPFTY
jgi:LysM repeat protein